VRKLLPLLLAALTGCGTITEENVDEAGVVSSSETIEYDEDGRARVVEKKVDPMAPYGTDEEGIREGEDMGLVGEPPL
jgi:hypothetical protein